MAWGCARGADVAPSVPNNALDGDEVTTWVDDSGEARLADAASTSWGRVCDGAHGDPQTATLYGKACAAGDGDGCRKLGLRYLCGVGVDKNAPVAATMFEKSCTLHDMEGCQLHAGSLLAGNVGARDTVRGLRVYLRACNEGSSRACGALGSILMTAGKPHTSSRAAELLEKACTQSQYDACGNLAIVELEGLGGRAKNPSRAATIARAACEKSDPFSCGVLGSLYMTGIGTSKDEAAAAKLFAISCEGGEALGCTHLAVCHYKGTGVPRDVQRASELFRKGCDGGNGQACRILAELSGSTSAPAVPSAASPTMF